MTGSAPQQEQRLNMLRPLVWQRRQMPPQQATTEPVPIDGVERMNTVVVREAEQGVGIPLRWDSYAMEID